MTAGEFTPGEDIHLADAEHATGNYFVHTTESESEVALSTLRSTEGVEIVEVNPPFRRRKGSIVISTDKTTTLSLLYESGNGIKELCAEVAFEEYLSEPL